MSVVRGVLPLACLVAISCVLAAAPVKIKGVSPADLSALRYSADEFTCRDGSKTIPFTQVNDDFCDCADGSDEPATPACANGHMYCANRGFTSKVIPASRVWDGICDCCDGSDEEGGLARKENPCQNTCKAMALEARKDQIAELETQREGLKVKEQYMQQAQKDFATKRVELDALKTRLVSLKNDRVSAEAEKKVADEAEAVARAALEEKQKAEEEAKRAAGADAPASTPEEHPAGIEDVHTEATDEVPRDDDRLLSESDDVDDFDIEEEDEAVRKDVPPPPPSSTPGDDEELKPLIEASKAAKDALDKIDNQISDVERDIKNIEDLFNFDFGPNNEFYALKGQCFSVNANEYSYELCPFEKCNQKPRSGASTLLGNWEQTDDWKQTHKTMSYTGGLRCWSGPDRSTKVSIFCGRENRVADPEEPSRCEYSLKLYTPAACSKEHMTALLLDLESDSEEEHH